MRHRSLHELSCDAYPATSTRSLLAVASDEKRAIVEWYLRRSIITTVAPGCKKAFEENPEEYIG
ncbi:MAG: hypothetical protein C5S52_08720 [ANME-2 cluster archaeon]|nr:hypothetical protein [ANME-2 cluster archaeon]